MSVCLTVTKSVALISAGLNSGLCFGGILSPRVTDASGKKTGTSSFDYHREIAVGVLSSLSAAFYAASYFGAPVQWRHPYLLYSGALAAVSTGITVFKLLRRAFLPALCARSRESHVDDKSAPAGTGTHVHAHAHAHAHGHGHGHAHISDNDDSDQGQDESVVLVSDSSNHSTDTPDPDTKTAPADLPVPAAHPHCCSMFSALTSDCVLNTARTVFSTALLVLGTVGGLGEPLALV
ncbi:unnamed protein product [Kluyveromyces dobzhanskii CBS 2104]|uniref:WGS project CCBQ000000000 data, contig 00017 n=1 Tax=Kluyveromyces dobzhanskii CBS 2104 TaxID=1427455 RepID=A0A0A8L8I6_9SACH|nr:unnamed protein product [Kluyveromyces dobzhanskii CBS 2104]